MKQRERQSKRYHVSVQDTIYVLYRQTGIQTYKLYWAKLLLTSACGAVGKQRERKESNFEKQQHNEWPEERTEISNIKRSPLNQISR